MIGKLTGVLDDVSTDHIILDVHGVGYVVYISGHLIRLLPPIGSDIILLIEMQMGEGFIKLYGFSDSLEREWFRLLLSVQGVGAKVALGILGTLGTDTLSRAIVLQDRGLIAQAQGVGPKLASRLLSELKEKATTLASKTSISTVSNVSVGSQSVPEQSNVISMKTDEIKTKKKKSVLSAPSPMPDPSVIHIKDALSALTNLGYNPSDAHQAVLKAQSNCQEQGVSVSLDSLIRLALKELSA